MKGKTDKLFTFCLVQDNKVISPPLTTIPEYARWLSVYFDDYIATDILYLNRKCDDGKVVSEYHPGTKIGQFFDNNSFNSFNLGTWKIQTDSNIMQTLIKKRWAQLKDANMNILRIYSVNQIELFVRQKIDPKFSIVGYYQNPRKISLVDSDIDKIIKPETQLKKSLF